MKNSPDALLKITFKKDGFLGRFLEPIKRARNNFNADETRQEIKLLNYLSGFKWSRFPFLSAVWVILYFILIFFSSASLSPWLFLPPLLKC